jgi:hypothetical protein
MSLHYISLACFNTFFEQFLRFFRPSLPFIVKCPSAQMLILESLEVLLHALDLLHVVHQVLLLILR